MPRVPNSLSIPAIRGRNAKRCRKCQIWRDLLAMCPEALDPNGGFSVSFAVSFFQAAGNESISMVLYTVSRNLIFANTKVKDAWRWSV